MNEATLSARVSRVIRNVPDFPKPGILFKDITPLLADVDLMHEVIGAMGAPFANSDVSHVVGIESRGFLFGMPLAMSMKVAFAPARKPGRLPRQTMSARYALEYGEDQLQMHCDAVQLGSRVLVVDDILATGGTADAVCRLVEQLGATVVGVSLLGEIDGLRLPTALAGRNVQSVVKF